MAEYIEREAAMSKFLYSFGKRKIEDIPAADVAPVVHGHWVFDHMTGEKSYYAYCSNCKKMRFFECKESEPPFCDMCGSRMDEEATDGN